MTKIFPWEPGRQGTGYRKLKLLEGSHFDVHLIDYPNGTWAPAHKDPIKGRRHLRINLVLLTGGSKLKSYGTLLKLGERLVAFWSDELHWATENRFRRIVLSLGLSLPEGIAKKEERP